MNLEKDLLHIGTIVNTFGTKGVIKIVLRKEINLISETSDIKLMFIKNNTSSIQPLRVESLEMKNGNLLGKFLNLDNINDVTKYKGLEIYALNSDNVFEEVILLENFKVKYGEQYGNIDSTLNNGLQDIIKVSFENEKSFWVPVVDVYVENIDKENGIITLKNIEGLK